MNDAALRTGINARMETAATWRRGNRGTRREMIPLNRVTVCAGRSCENATRKEICSGMVPLIVVNLQ